MTGIVNSSYTPATTPVEPSVGQTRSVADSPASSELLPAHLSRLVVLGELIGTTTHEFNNVLMTIINYAKLGLRNTDTATRTNALQKILDAGERAAKITRSILAVSRNRNGEFEPTDLGSLVSDVLILMEREFRKYRVKVDFSVSSTALVRGIPSQLQQVILNMLVNARQAMLDGGEVQIRIQQDTHADCVSLSIRDSGQGIAQDQLSRIFEPYYSTKAGPDATGRGGTGLGLSACREIIRAHRGRIRVESTVGRGTCFTIRLPVWQNTEGAPQVSVSD